MDTSSTKSSLVSTFRNDLHARMMLLMTPGRSMNTRRRLKRYSRCPMMAYGRSLHWTRQGHLLQTQRLRTLQHNPRFLDLLRFLTVMLGGVVRFWLDYPRRSGRQDLARRRRHGKLRYPALPIRVVISARLSSHVLQLLLDKLEAINAHVVNVPLLPTLLAPLISQLLLWITLLWVTMAMPLLGKS